MIATPPALKVSSVQDPYGAAVENPVMPSVIIIDPPAPVPVPQPEPPKPENTGSNGIIFQMILIVVFGFLLNLCVAEYRDHGAVGKMYNKVMGYLPISSAPESSASNSDEATEPNDANFDYKVAYDNLSKRVDALEKGDTGEMLEVKRKMTLIAIVSDENTMVAKAGGKDYLYIDQNWHINRMPRYVPVNSKNKKFLEERLSH